MLSGFACEFSVIHTSALPLQRRGLQGTFENFCHGFPVGRLGHKMERGLQQQMIIIRSLCISLTRRKISVNQITMPWRISKIALTPRRSSSEVVLIFGWLLLRDGEPPASSSPAILPGWLGLELWLLPRKGPAMTAFRDSCLPTAGDWSIKRTLPSLLKPPCCDSHTIIARVTRKSVNYCKSLEKKK